MTRIRGMKVNKGQSIVIRVTMFILTTEILMAEVINVINTPTTKLSITMV